MAGNTAGGRAGRRLARGSVAAVAVALAAAAGCGGGSDEGDGVANAFCDEFAGYEQRFQSGASHDDVLAALRALDPPEEIAADVETLAGAVEQLSSVDSSNPDAISEFQAGPSAEAERANANILGYVEAECSEP